MTLKSTIEEFHKVGLTHVVKKLKDDPHGKQLLFELVDEPTVYALFAMHGLVRADLKTQVSRVIEMAVRTCSPTVASHLGRCKRQNSLRSAFPAIAMAAACHQLRCGAPLKNRSMSMFRD
jgi:hypothetical protein